MHSLKFIFIMLQLISNTDAWRRRRRTTRKCFSVIPQDQNFQTSNITTTVVNRRCKQTIIMNSMSESFSLFLLDGDFRPLYIIYFSLFYAYFFIFFILFFKKSYYLFCKHCILSKIAFPLGTRDILHLREYDSCILGT